MPKVTNKLVQNGKAIFGPDPAKPDSLICLTGRRGRHSDGDGLYFVVGHKGEHRWAFLYKSRTRKLQSGLPKPVEMGIGGAPDGTGRDAVSLANARKRAKEHRKALHDKLDPLEEARKAKAEAAAPAPVAVVIAAPTVIASPDGQLNETFGAVADRYFQENRASWKNPKHVAQWKRDLQVTCGPLRPLMVRNIDTPDILALLTPIFATKYESARRLQERINRVMESATVQKLRDNTPSPARWKGNLDRALPRKAATARKGHAALPFAEAPSFMQDLSKRNSISALALRWTICTAARTSETTHAQWREIDLDAKLWIVPAHRMKGAKEHRVPLTDSLLALLADVRRVSHGDYIFAIGHSAPLSNMAMAELLKGMRPGVTVHGFRSTFSDWANETTEHDSKVVDFCLAHVNGDKAEAAYRRGTSLNKRRKILEDWEKFLIG